jgi:plasmid stabilization system protein ParE
MAPDPRDSLRRLIDAAFDFAGDAGEEEAARVIAKLAEKMNPNPVRKPTRGRGRPIGKSALDPFPLLMQMARIDLTDRRNRGRALTALAHRLHGDRDANYGATPEAIRKRMERLLRDVLKPLHINALMPPVIAERMLSSRKALLDYLFAGGEASRQPGASTDK